MRLNDLTPAEGSRVRRKRVGRGPGSGHGTRCGRGDKGQKSRSGGLHKQVFEGGQMPLHRRLPKRGFRSRTPDACAEVRLHELGLVGADTVDLAALKRARIVSSRAERAKVIASGELDRAIVVRGLAVTAGARERIEKAGGKVED